jgi:phosphohistidine phosphatase
MRRVYLLRHAKSSWKDRSLADATARSRGGAGRGKRATKALAGHLGAEGIRPDLVFCSPARRTRETLERVEAAFGDNVLTTDAGRIPSDSSPP